MFKFISYKSDIIVIGYLCNTGKPCYLDFKIPVHNVNNFSVKFKTSVIQLITKSKNQKQTPCSI